MPLKHKTETRLIGLLGLAIAVTGLLMAQLPLFPKSIIPWGVLFACSVLYPLVLYPLFRRDRADYEFRLLHWWPAAMLIVWLLLDVGAFMQPSLQGLRSVVTWVWSLPLVALGFLLIMWFVLHVIRRRVPRLTTLLLILVPFSALGFYANQSQMGLDTDMLAQVWEEKVAGSVDRFVAVTNEEEKEEEQESSEPMEEMKEEEEEEKEMDKNLAPSQDPNEERWRESLRQYEDGSYTREGLEEENRNGVSSAISSLVGTVGGDMGGEEMAMKEKEVEEVQEVEEEEMKKEEVVDQEELPSDLQPGGSGAHIREVVSTPSSLPASGLGLSLIILSMIALYCGVLHDRARRRV